MATTFAAAIRDGLATALAVDDDVICFGLGTDDPKGVFGTTLDLHKQFGPDRVFDMPTSEAAMTGFAIGAALNGMRPVMTHQRLDFALLSLDQLVNNAAKWRFMFGGKRGVPITIRMIIGRGWGQGPTHSQSLQSWFAHIPGLKVVMPTTAEDAKGLLLGAIFDDDPVIFLEHRWLHNMKGEVPAGDVRSPLGKARIVRQGDAVTIVAMSYMTVEALHAVDHLAAQGIACDLIDLRSIRPLDWPAVIASVQKTGRLLALDSGHLTGGVAGEIVARVATDHFASLKSAPQRLAAPDVPEATSPALTKNYHVRAEHIAEAVGRMLGREVEIASLVAQRTFPHDVPGTWFSGPF
ncbi:Pyruvate dehydrogenase E1 component subunit beta [Rhodopseudomonas palustris]|uniref:Acetoin dehydrogenase (TPP-dependent) beta chain n=1 Tax=Rhodopseudomonas palustris (strain ATCC BAA-98 / CGA009) TaxID=258594 RepID=Q6N2X6_RHOPA|nr:transketolase C-terminal domain-containing protein [Rhodopseudomonas palustris]OPF92781.1 alpha-ketoacid dehydrogenase subunit beta [Rhodopseudomonas palustris]QQM05481.1 Pyruvate dehydrogenase E1 component subunit beta [Rhodopseudomonas palustris]RJF63361.1 alpha-ketoacid dehydrogenase subunit beta [Rhodopseudomonas palustris]WAB76819.1 alpha-ketoacid dehydrogenase subunit beta [Rhodopseudomonas palustris]WCL94107.1 transketolase C-terminal domain-containing protein [Rhodopseudomonas palus